MRGQELLDRMNLVDPAYVEAADQLPKKKKQTVIKWGALAACLCLALVGAALLPKLQNAPALGPDPAPVPAPGEVILREEEPEAYPEHPILHPGEEGYVEPEPSPEEPDEREHPLDPGTFLFNEPTAAMDICRAYIPGCFTEELDETELAAVTPDRLAAGMTLSGFARFDGEGRFLSVSLTVQIPSFSNPLSVVFEKGEPLICYVVEGGEAISTVNGTELRLYQGSYDEENHWLQAYGSMGEYAITVSYDAVGISLEQAQNDLITVLHCFTYKEPDFSAITAEYIPPYIFEELTFAEAQADPDFGAYLPTDLPEGFAEERFHRHMEQNVNYLSGLWSKGWGSDYGELRWEITFFDESKQQRLTAAANTQNYDLSLYPIPRADSVPEELREIVDNPIFLAEELTLEVVQARAYKVQDAGDSHGWRMAFSVKYDDIVVEVCSKGIDPQWVYDQLAALRDI